MAATTSAETLVAVATYNEIENLPRLADEIFEFAPHVHLLVVDDGSPDGTGRWAAERAGRDDRVRLLQRGRKLGLGTAMVAGMKYAIDHGYRFHVTMDGDYSHHPRYLPDLLAAMEPPGAPPVDVAIGSRYIPGGSIEGWPLSRHMMSRGVNWYTHLLLRLKPRDCSGGYRCYRVEKLAELEFERLKSHGYSIVEEVLFRLVQNGCRTTEVPITFVDRIRGRSKIGVRESLNALKVISQLGLQNLWPGGKGPRPASRSGAPRAATCETAPHFAARRLAESKLRAGEE